MQLPTIAQNPLLALVDRQPLTLPATASVTEAITSLRTAKAEYVLASGSQQVVGLLTAYEALAGLDTTATLASTARPCHFHDLDLPVLPALLALYRQHQTRYLVLLDEAGQLYGVLSRDRLLDDPDTSRTIESVAPTAFPAIDDNNLGTTTYFRELVEAIPDIFYLVAADFSQIFYISPAYERLWDRSCANLYQCPESWVNSIHSQDRDRVITAAKARAQGKPFCEEYRIIQPNGSQRWVLDRAFAIRDADGQIVRFAGAVKDITERKKTNWHCDGAKSVSRNWPRASSKFSTSAPRISAYCSTSASVMKRSGSAAAKTSTPTQRVG